MLSSDQFRRLAQYGTRHAVGTGEQLFRVGDRAYDLILLDTATAQVLAESALGATSRLISTRQPGDFLGEISLLTGQRMILTAVVVSDGDVIRVSPSGLRRAMAEHDDLADVMTRELTTRRRHLRNASGSSLELIGAASMPAARPLREYVAHLQLPHLWLEVNTPAADALMQAAHLTERDLPAAVLGDQVMRSVTPALLAERLGMTVPRDAEPVDLVVVGAGPAGLAAGVYGASEGLSTVVLDARSPGGQSSATSRIENYLGFPGGVSGQELVDRATSQALKFGARLYVPCAVDSMSPTEHGHRLVLTDATKIDARAVIVASGAQYRRLDLARWGYFERAGCIFFAATELEVADNRAHPVTVVGGANSGGQAALFLADSGSRVDLVIRGPELGASMSSYLVDRVCAHPLIHVHASTQVTGLLGEDRLDGVELTSCPGGEVRRRESVGLYCFIGAEPCADWATDVRVDDAGFVLTDADLVDASRRASGLDRFVTVGRLPLPFETSVPGVFAAGDVRRGSMKRVAAAVGEGASAVASVHKSLAHARSAARL